MDCRFCLRLLKVCGRVCLANALTVGARPAVAASGESKIEDADADWIAKM
jgi:hypothetical protein